MTLFYAAILLALASGWWVIHPLVRRQRAPLADPLPGGILDAEARKRVALASLKEIEYDRLGGKLDDDDYQGLRRQLEREALAAIDAAGRLTGDAGAADTPLAAPTRHTCGFANPAGSRFCSGCGSRLS